MSSHEKMVGTGGGSTETTAGRASMIKESKELLAQVIEEKNRRDGILNNYKIA